MKNKLFISFFIMTLNLLYSAVFYEDYEEEEADLSQVDEETAISLQIPSSISIYEDCEEQEDDLAIADSAIDPVEIVQINDLKKGIEIFEREIELEKNNIIAEIEKIEVLLKQTPSEMIESLIVQKIEQIHSSANKVDALNENKKKKLDLIKDIIKAHPALLNTEVEKILFTDSEKDVPCSIHCEQIISEKLKHTFVVQSASPAATSNEEKSASLQPNEALSSECSACDQPHRIDVRHVDGGGIGYNQGYSTFGGYFSRQRNDYIPFVDVRGHVFNNGKFAANAGLGLRYLLNPLTSMIGGNIYYDYRNTNHYHYNQVGAGLEAFFSRWEYHLNGYYPVGKHKKKLKHNFDGLTFNSFLEHFILMNENFTDTSEFAMRGFDAEIGAHCLNECDRDLYVGVGPYYFNADKGKTTWGGKIRIKAQITKYFSLEVTDSVDHLFHNRLQGSIALNFPLGKQKKQTSKNRSLSNNLLCKIAQESPQRQEIIVVNKSKKTYSKDPVVAVDPATGLPFFVVFLDNTNTNPNPNGTFANPFPTALAAQNNSVAGDTIYAFLGDGTTNGMNAGIVLKNNQRFLGSGVSHQYNTTLGALNIPPQTFFSPHISNPAANIVIDLGNAHATEVSGFNIDMTNTNTIGIRGNGTTGLTVITRNTITGQATMQLPANNGIQIAATNDVFIDSNVITNTGRNAIRVDGGSAPNQFTISNNTAIAPFENAIFIDGGNINVSINNNQVTQSSGGFLIFNNGAPITGTFFRNNFSNNVQNGIAINPNSHPVALQFINNHMDNNLFNGILVQPSGAGSVCVQFIDNVATGNGSFGYNLNGATATINEEPASDNIGTFSRTNVTSVPEGFCPF